MFCVTKEFELYNSRVFSFSTKMHGEQNVKIISEILDVVLCIVFHQSLT
jgi:hypothetical protein